MLTASRTLDPAVVDAAMHDKQPEVRAAARSNPNVTADALARYREAEREAFVERAREFGGRRGGVVDEVQVDWDRLGSVAEVDALVAARRVSRQQLARAEAVYGIEARRGWESLREQGDARARGLLNAAAAFNAREWPLGLRAKITPEGLRFAVPHGDGARVAPVTIPFPEGATRDELNRAWDAGYRRAVVWAQCPPVERWPAAERAHLARLRRYADMAQTPAARKLAAAWESAARGERPIPSTGYPPLDPATISEREWGAQVAAGLASDADLRGAPVELRHHFEAAAARGDRAARVHADRLRHWAGQSDLGGRTTIRRDENGRLAVTVTPPSGGPQVVARIPVRGKPTPLSRAWREALAAARATLASDGTGTMRKAA